VAAAGPRIYNLFPLLAGPVPAWAGHLDRITGMGFDWVFVNPFHYPGFSGSLYAVKDYYRLHPLLGDADARPGKLLKDFTRAAGRQGAAVMMDLVINHTAKDAVLVDEHPEWYKRDADGELRSPRAVDPVDPRKFTVWGDLAEIDYDNPNVRPAQIEYWVELVRHHLKLGFKGLRCDAAYQVPVEVWQAIIEQARAAEGEFDGVVAMYHDQGLGPLKLLAFDEGVSVTLGLPIIRTSPDHGTAFGIAGKGIARPDSMRHALLAALELSQRPNPWTRVPSS